MQQGVGQFGRKISGCSPWSRPLMFGSAESEHPRLANGEITSEKFQPMWSQSTNVTDGQTDKQTDDIRSQDRKSASRGKIILNSINSRPYWKLPTILESIANRLSRAGSSRLTFDRDSPWTEWLKLIGRSVCCWKLRSRRIVCRPITMDFKKQEVRYTELWPMPIHCQYNANTCKHPAPPPGHDPQCGLWHRAWTRNPAITKDRVSTDAVNVVTIQ